MALRRLGFSSLFAVGHVLFFYMTYITHFHCGMAQRNPPPGVSSTNSADLYTYGRGDIPMLHPKGLQELLIAELRKLIIAIRTLDGKLVIERNATIALRLALENCKACQIKKPECSDVPNVCFPEVECRDTFAGPVCGQCPEGWCGDGKQCERCMCGFDPCYPGVTCHESETKPFFKCGKCPEGYRGNGIQCFPLPCQHSPYPCFQGVECFNTDCPPYFRCGPCPAGLTGNGTYCSDVDECGIGNPCFDKQSCLNTAPGFRCGPCPSGFTGSRGVIGIDHRTPKQQCVDTDECRVNNGDCAQNSACFNTPGSFHCGACDAGYDGNQSIGCWAVTCPAN